MKLRRKLLVVLLAAILAACVGVTLGGGHLLRQAVRDRTIDRLERELELLEHLVPPSGDLGALQDFAGRVSRDLEVRFTLIDRDGKVLVDSSVQPELVAGMENHRDRPEIEEAASLGRGESARVSGTTGVEYYYLARCTDARGAVRYLRLALPGRDLEKFELQYLLLLIAAALFAMLILGSLSYALVGRLSRPVEHMTAVAERVAAGDLDQSVPVYGEDEVRRLGQSVQSMKETWASKLDQLDAQRKLLLTMTDGLEEGLLLCDADRRILIANRAVRSLFRSATEPTGLLVGELVRNPTVLEELERCLANGDDHRVTIRGPVGTNRSFEVHVTPVDVPSPDPRKGALALFFDITRLEALEGVRRQFVADISHELRTPVTAIKGAIDTLSDCEGGAGEGAGRFLDIARRQADRMTELINDLTDLSRIETGAIRLEVAQVDFARMARDVVAAVRSRHGSDAVDVVTEVPEGFTVKADPKRLEQILTNLVDNAVKFTPKGGGVWVKAERRNGYDVFSVSDSGPGIPQESHDRVFTRFYRLDKSRARAAGGTGLGLAIVKHLVKLHHGSVRLESEPGHGARFIVELPHVSNTDVAPELGVCRALAGPRCPPDRRAR